VIAADTTCNARFLLQQQQISEVLPNA